MLAVFNAGQALLDAAVTPPFCAALRSCTLTTLWLTAVRLFDDPAVGVAVVDALAGHPTIEVLWLAGNPAASPEDRPGAGAALARLLTPGGVLRELHIKRNLLSDAGLRPVLAALPGCARLRALHLQGNGATRAFARDELLPAVAAAPGLRVLQADDDPSVPELAQAEALVAARPRGA